MVGYGSCGFLLIREARQKMAEAELTHPLPPRRVEWRAGIV